MPQTTPPLIWLRAVFALMMRPAATALTTRVTRTVPSVSSTRPSQKTAEWLVKRKAVHVIASDAHDPVGRKPIMSEARAAIAEMAGAEVADALVTIAAAPPQPASASTAIARDGHLNFGMGAS